MKGKKKILLAVVLVLVMAVGITSIVVIRKRNKIVVKVFPVSSLNSSDWFDTDTSLTGTLTSDFIQEVHVSGGQKVKKIYVKKGDKVKKGDVLLKYNVAEKELDLKLQKLQIQSSKLEIAEMEKELKKLKNTKTVGSINTGNSSVMDASVNLSDIKGTSLRYLMAEAESDGTTAVSNSKAANEADGNSGSESGSGSGSSPGSESGSGSGGSSGSESGSGSGSGSGSESGSGSGGSSGSEGGSGEESGKDDAKLSLKSSVNDISDKASGSGTEKDPYIFNLTMDGKVKGSFIKKLITDGSYAEFRAYKSEEAKKTSATFELDPSTKVNVYAEDGYTVNQLNEGGDTKTLHNSIDLVSEKDASSGNGSSAGNAYIYYLNVNGLVKGSVISSLHKENKYATFIEFDENGKEKDRYEYNPSKAFKDLDEDAYYTVSKGKEKSLHDLNERATYKDLKAESLEDGQQGADGKYTFYLPKDGKISGALINDLIKKGLTAEFIEYASETDYDNENTANANKLEIVKMIGSRVDSPEKLLERLEELRKIIREKKTESDCPFILSTMHASKGLEYDTVYLLDVMDGILPEKVLVNPRTASKEELETYEEERRLFYVGVTRAKNQLNVFTTNKPSKFCSELLGKRNLRENRQKEYAGIKKWGDYSPAETYGVKENGMYHGSEATGKKLSGTRRCTWRRHDCKA